MYLVRHMRGTASELGLSDGIVSGVGRKWKRSHSYGPDSVELMTPLTTPIFDFH